MSKIFQLLMELGWLLFARRRARVSAGVSDCALCLFGWLVISSITLSAEPPRLTTLTNSAIKYHVPNGEKTQPIATLHRLTGLLKH